MPAHHRFHPYEIQAIALYVSLLPGLAAAALAFGSSYLERLQRSRKPATLSRLSMPILLENAA